MAGEIEAENARRLAEIAAAPDWPTTLKLMYERNAWWSLHRKWDEQSKSWIQS
jgi:hypothetical protein